MWPLKRHRAELKQTSRQEVTAGKQELAAKIRQQEAERLVAQSRNVTQAWRRELEKNGFTELFQQAMRRA